MFPSYVNGYIYRLSQTRLCEVMLGISPSSFNYQFCIIGSCSSYGPTVSYVELNSTSFVTMINITNEIAKIIDDERKIWSGQAPVQPEEKNRQFLLNECQFVRVFIERSSKNIFVSIHDTTKRNSVDLTIDEFIVFVKFRDLFVHLTNHLLLHEKKVVEVYKQFCRNLIVKPQETNLFNYARVFSSITNFDGLKLLYEFGNICNFRVKLDVEYEKNNNNRQ